MRLLEAVVATHGLEGVIAKRLNSKYSPTNAALSLRESER
jgi:ATP-dependent DNA ligase